MDEKQELDLVRRVLRDATGINFKMPEHITESRKAKIRFQTGETYDIIGERPQLWVFQRPDGTIGKVTKGLGTFDIYDVNHPILGVTDPGDVQVVDHTFDLEDSDETA